ncbi:Leucine Rich Repeat (LRR)-containing isoform A [Micractinium conductrix]|uniref:Leucine Rich Repeat (LRR)-containing isoform A n=1 Tax=Micractinium conductrix TaxID=554055 RepID=A0A2P6V5B5_9CHLO|nr:Leucine Rich Repeat (LRR)-containing isoform A [Micractinium conductrix]|eukprot:PSC69285.1 Leucine Rich Repeat (LRR)-containing isoform A [Micractinium conductrix]
MEEEPGGRPGIEELPDPLLVDVLVLAGARCSPAAALVCQRWRRLALSEPRLLASLHVPRCSVVERAGATTASRWRLSDLLALAHPAALRELSLCGGASLPEGSAAHLRRLSCLTSLTLRSLCLEDLPPGVALTGLRELDLSVNWLEQLPPALVAAPCLALTRLSLSRNHLASLLARPYLADISLNWFHSLPRSLADATSLRRLVLWCGFTSVGWGWSALELSAGDVDHVLARMHTLRTLELRGSRTPPPVWDHLRRRLPGLQLV